MKRIFVPLTVFLALSSWSSAQVPPADAANVPQSPAAPAFFGTTREFIARPGSGIYFMVDYTDPYGLDETGVWDYPFQTYGIDHDFDGYYEPVTRLRWW